LTSLAREIFLKHRSDLISPLPKSVSIFPQWTAHLPVSSPITLVATGSKSWVQALRSPWPPIIGYLLHCSFWLSYTIIPFPCSRVFLHNSSV
jgi:hypothetical protein